MEYFDSSQGGDHSVLIVDDDVAIQKLLHESLHLQRHHILSAQSGEEALRIAQESRPSLIILDISLPGMNGFEIMERLKRNSATARIPVMFLSASDIYADKLMGLRLGAVDFISKPVHVQEMVVRVRNQMKLSRTQERLKSLLKRHEELLCNIMPPSVAQRLCNGEEEVVERIPEATIFFCDLVGFTALATKMSAERLVTVIDSIFFAIDRVAERHGVEKIKTIGDAYMAASGVSGPAEDHAVQMVDFALDLRQDLTRVERDWSMPIRFRIGIHSGEVIAGTFGAKRIAYDIWGETVNTASRLESTCAPSQIHISKETLDRLNNQYEITPRGPTELRGKGILPTFYVNRRNNKRCSGEAEESFSTQDVLQSA